MNSRTKGYMLLLFCFFSCKSEKEKTATQAFGKSILIEVEQLLENSTASDIKIIDFRKKEAYVKGHIPNAIRVWRTDIEDSSFSYKGMMASRKQIEQLFSKLGIKSDDTLVLYDDNGSCDAARLWWVLKCYGFENTKILNGGLKAYMSAKAKLSKDLPQFANTVFTLPNTTFNKHHISKNELLQKLQDSIPHILIDTRTLDEYSGKRHKKGAAKAGRIPGSTLIDWAHSVDFDGSQKFKSEFDLNNLYGDLGKTKEKEVIVYCHSGVRSAHTTFVLTELLGFENVRNYDGSWTEWSQFDNLPFEKDSITVILQ